MVIMKRPFGITIIAGLVAFVGGTMTLVMIIEIFDTIRMLGLQGVQIDSPASFLGFILYGVTPVFFYTVGFGLFMSRRWAYLLLLRVFPILFFFLMLNITVNAARAQMYYYSQHSSFLKLLLLNPQIFLLLIFLYFVVIWPMLSYLRLPYIEDYFKVTEKTS